MQGEPRPEGRERKRSFTGNNALGSENQENPLETGLDRNHSDSPTRHL